MPANAFTCYVFVDFENVPSLDLGLIEGMPVHVALLIGKNQKKLDLALVQLIHRLASQVELVEVGASGHNALDLALAYYLGRAAQHCPQARFYIVSKDKDYEPLIAHLSSKGTSVDRCDSLAALPFLPKPGKHRPIRATVSVKSDAPARAAVPAKASAPCTRLEKLVARLKNNLAPRPKKKSSLLAHINTVFGGRLSEAEQTEKLDELVSRGVLTIDAKDKVGYGPVRQS
jgi:PIN domain